MLGHCTNTAGMKKVMVDGVYGGVKPKWSLAGRKSENAGMREK
jgi:hypothetical protein